SSDLGEDAQLVPEPIEGGLEPRQDLGTGLVGARRLFCRSAPHAYGRDRTPSECGRRCHHVDFTRTPRPDFGAPREPSSTDDTALRTGTRALARPHRVAAALTDLGAELVTPPHVGASYPSPSSALGRGLSPASRRSWDCRSLPLPGQPPVRPDWRGRRRRPKRWTRRRPWNSRTRPSRSRPWRSRTRPSR